MAAAVIINVDDNDAARYAKGRILTRAGFTVYDAANGVEALKLIREQQSDLVLLDVQLPDLNGIEVCRRIKSEQSDASVIVLQISALATAAPQATRALDSGADAYLVEPVEPEVLVATINALLRLRKAERELSLANDRLKKVNRDLQRSNEDLRQFAYAASHDLQEPLRTVTSFASLLERSSSGKLADTEREYLRYIVDGAKRMRLLIEDLLSYSQVDQKPMAHQAVDLNAAVAWALENLRDSIAESSAEVSYGGLPVVIGDGAQLGQVFQNLIGNAIKYARPQHHPVIDVSAAGGAGHWTICVSDNGIGIEEPFLKAIFSPFKRLHGKEIPGTGIGLAVTRKVIEAHGGRIWVESKPDEGSTFFFCLPVMGAS